MITVLIPTQDQEASYLACALDSLKSHTRVPYEVMIWDNGSKDETQDFVSENMSKYNISEYFRSEKNIGLSKPYNTIFKEANFDHVYISDNDFYFMPNWDCIINDVKDTKYGWAQGHLIEQLRPKRSIVDSFGWHPTNLRHEALLNKYKNYVHPHKHKANFMPALISKSAYFEIGGYDESICIHEADFLKRAHDFYKGIGYERICNNKSFIYHFRSISRSLYGKNSPRPEGDWQKKMFDSMEQKYNKSIDEIDEEIDYYGRIT